VKLTAATPLADLLAHVRPALDAGGVLITSGHDTTRTDNPVVLSTLQLLVHGDDPEAVTARRRAVELTR
jgi:hypothetical protein